MHMLVAATCVLVLAFCCSGCENIVQSKYNIEDYHMEENSGVYCFTDYLADLENVVAAAMCDDDRILLYEELPEGNLIHKKIWFFSYLTGEKQLGSSISQVVDENYFSAPDRYNILSTKPLVLKDVYENSIYIYTEDLSEYSILSFEDYAMPQGMFVRDSKLYFMDFNTCKVYVHGLDEYSAAGKQVNYKTFCNEAQNVFVPHFNMGACSLENVSEDGECLRIYAECLQENEHYYYVYNIKQQTFEEKYRFKDQKDILWNAWDYGKDLAKVQPSPVDRFKMTDYTLGKTYETKIEPEIIYSYVKVDENISETQGKILIYVVDENKERMSEIFLWDYAKAEAKNAGQKKEKIFSEVPREIDYADLTDKAEEMEEKYGINIVMGENVTCDFGAYDYEQVTDEGRIYSALEELELAMGAFPDGMCEEMTQDYALGFNVYLCGAFTPKNKENISDAGAFFSFDNGYYNLAMNIMEDCLEANVIHEMTHAIDNYFVYCGAAEQLETDWQACNPEGFAYLDSYFDYEEHHEQTFFGDFEDIDEVYFVDEYSKTFPTEDRSRVFEKFASEYSEGEWLLQAQPLRRKARLLLDYCTEYLECFRADEEYGLKTKAEQLGW
ncbi:MAG: hypothetical protein IJ429_06010 [Lachnospiraceae bacterium]|nr:hypothetical protein [Lachnospiraceae bacterium]